jgi:hypothetical protein
LVLPGIGRLAGKDAEILGPNINELQYMVVNALREIDQRLRLLEAATKN